MNTALIVVGAVALAFAIVWPPRWFRRSSSKAATEPAEKWAVVDRGGGGGNWYVVSRDTGASEGPFGEAHARLLARRLNEKEAIARDARAGRI